jgi:YesN/AraC family two-component response regulator
MIDLLITDVIMPGMNGKDLAHNLQSMNPQLKCLYMSGYTADAISQHGVLDEGVCFIQKPFSLPDLATKVREVLDSK